MNLWLGSIPALLPNWINITSVPAIMNIHTLITDVQLQTTHFKTIP